MSLDETMTVFAVGSPHPLWPRLHQREGMQAVTTASGIILILTLDRCTSSDVRSFQADGLKFGLCRLCSGYCWLLSTGTAVFDAPYTPAIERPDRQVLPWWRQDDREPEERALVHLQLIDSQGILRALGVFTVSSVFARTLETLHAAALTKGPLTRAEWDLETAAFNRRCPTPRAGFRQALATCWGNRPEPTSRQLRGTAMQAKDTVEYLIANPVNCEFVLVEENGRRVGDVGSFIIRLLRANDGWLEPTELRASNFLGSGRGETRAVGVEIDALYGFGGMYAVHQIIESLLPDGAAGELEAAWSRIGDWEW